jgi:hypothetical protein
MHERNLLESSSEYQLRGGSGVSADQSIEERNVLQASRHASSIASQRLHSCSVLISVDTTAQESL